MRAALVAVLLLAGCASAEKFKQHMDSTLGYTEGQLVARLGPPDRAYDAGDGTKVLQYVRSSSWTMPGQTTKVPQTSYGTVMGPTGNIYTGQTTTYTTQTTPAQTFTSHCAMNFIVTGGRVTSWKSQGNGCKV